MAEQDNRASAEDGEYPAENMPSTAMDVGEDDGVDGEIEEEGEEPAEGKTRTGRGNRSVGQSPPSSRDTGDKSGGGESKKHRSSSDRRRHHHHHHSSSSHRDHRRRRSGGHTSDGDGDGHGSDEDTYSSGRSRRRSESIGESQSEHNIVTDKSSRSSPRKHHDRRSSRNSSNQSSGQPQQQRSRQSLEESSDNGEWSESHEDPLGPAKDSVNKSRIHSREKKDSHRVSMGTVAEKGEAEDGEILEDGELDDDEEEVEGRGGEEANKDSSTEVSPAKSSSKEEVKGDNNKPERKKPDHKDRRKRDSEDKKKRKKYTDVDNAEEESSPAPAWGSGYQGPKPKASPFRNKQQPRFGRGSKGYQSPPGLYDSPSYSEDSEEEIPKGLMTEGYIDASVAADEKEGIFNQKAILPKKKKRERIYERNDRKRGRMDGKFDGPPKKKPLVDLAMSERPVCKFYMEGKCAKGSGCQFNHDVEKPRKMEVCKYHLTVKGCHKEKCQYMHEDFPCKYYHTGAKCYSGDRCKFSHDPLTEDTRRALEMRVAAEDIIDMENPDYDYDYRPREREYDVRNRPSLLGSPPRYRPDRPDMKKIPSLFEIEVHPPGQSPKPSPQAPRPSGFYNETNMSPKPGMGHNAGGGHMNSPNMGMMGGGGPMNQNNQQGHANNQGPNMGGPGLLQAPMRGPNMMGGPMGNRPNMMGNQQGMNSQQQRPGGGPPIQFMGPGQMNNNQQQQPQQQQQGGNLPPVLNMLGAIIREAAMQKGPGGPSNNNNNNVNMGPNNMGPNSGMGPNNMRPNMNNMGPNMNMGPNNMRQGNMNNMGPSSNMAPNSMGNMAPNSMGNMAPNSMGNMPPNSMGNMPPNSMGNMPSNTMGNMAPNSMNNMGPMNMGQNMMGPNSGMGHNNNMGPNGGMGSMGNMGPPSTMGPPTSMSNMGPNSNNMGSMMGNNSNMSMGQPNMGQEVGIMDVDYRIKRDYEEIEEASQDLKDLDKIRRQLQEEIDKEDEERGDEEDEEGDEDMKMQINEDMLSPDRAGSSPGTEESKDEKAALKAEVEAELENLEIPAHLPKKQRELFKRIQQQQLLREKERERQEALKLAEEAEAKAEVDDWYSSDEDGEGEKKPKLTDVLKKLSQEPSASSRVESSVSSSATSGSFSTSSSSSTTTPSTASAFNIMQMINAIKSQTTAPTGTTATKSGSEIMGAITSLAATKLSSSIAQDPRQQKASLADSPASPPSSPSAKKQLSDVSGLHHPSMPSLHLPALTVDPPVVSARPMKPLVYGVVKISLGVAKPYTQLPNDVNASDPAFKNDPRVRWHLQYLEKQMVKEQQRRNSVDSEKPLKPADPRLKKAGSGDPRLAKAGDSPGSGQGDGARVSDPRLQRGPAPSRPADPRLARQAGAMDPRLNRQNSQSSQDSSNFMGGPMNNMGAGPMNSMGGMMGNQIGGPMGNMGGPMNSQMGGAMNNPMGGAMNNSMGGPMNNMGPMGNMGGPMNNQMGGPMNNQMGGPMNSQMGGPMNQMGAGMNTMGGGPGRQMQNGGPMNNMGPMGSNMNMMGGAMNNMGGGMNQMGGPGGLMGPGPNQMNRMGGPQGPQGNNMGGPGNSNMMGSGPASSMMRGPMGQQNPMNSDSGMLDPRMNNPADPRMGGQRPANDPRSGSDPRLRNKPMDPREQRMSTKDMRPAMRDPRSMSISSPNDDGLNDPRTSGYSSDQGSFQSNLRGQNDYRQSPNDYSSSDAATFGGSGQFKMSQGRDEWSQDPASRRTEPDNGLPSLTATSAMRSPSTQDSENEAQKTARKFDHRNDPRFKRVKRLAGEQKSNMEYSSPLGGEDGQGGSDDGGDLGYNSYSRPRLSTRDPRARNTPSPSLPDTLQDFELPPDREPDLKVKDLFKTIDPTASPFC